MLGKVICLKLKELARKFNIIIAWFYGEADHGKGLVDAISSYRCKQPITNTIITEDKWFQNASVESFTSLW